MSDLKTVIQVQVEYHNGKEDEGQPYYVAFSDDLHFVTEADTFEELLENIRECLALALEDTDSVEKYGVVRGAEVKLIMELPHAQTA